MFKLVCSLMFVNISRFRTFSVMYSVFSDECRGVWGPSSLSRTCSHGRRATSLKFMMLPMTFGEAVHHPRNPEACNFVTARLKGIGITHHVKPRWWRYHAASARRAMRHPHFFILKTLCESLPCSVLSNRDCAVPLGGKGSWKGSGTKFILSTSG